ncbi:MAG: hypothetical protein ACYCQJ_10880 [Nitrososphaerales archaeon]
MEDTDANISQAVKQVRSVFSNVSLLLRTCDELMEKKSWHVKDQFVWRDSSTNITRPERWLPSELHRFYLSKAKPNILAYVAILLDDDKEGYYTIDRAVVTAGMFDYGSIKVDDDNWDHSYCQFYAYDWRNTDSQLRRPGDYQWGSIIDSGPRSEWERDWVDEEDKYDFESFRYVAIPLSSVNNPAEVESKIILPLLGMTSPPKIVTH